MGNHPSNHIPLERNGVGKFGDAHTRRSLRSPRKMDRLRRSFRDSFRRRKDRVPESSKPHQWQADESAVRSGTCTFAVKYLGCVEVFDSRGMQVCEEALKVLRGSRRRPVRAVLHVSGDGLRVVEEDTKGLIVDQTIEKVSFCAPDRNHERGFSYICRDGTTRRWMCHGFLALRESGERLSHAVGCAFAVCLERKQKRDKECGVTMMFDAKNNTFTRTGSFRQQSITERDYNSEWAAKNCVVNMNNGSTLPVKSEAKSIGIDVGPNSATKSSTVNPFAIERPHATPSMLQRQGSCRGFSTLGENSPFKRQMSLRVNDLPSNAARLSQFTSPTSPTRNGSLTGDLRPAVSPIPEFAKSIRQWSMISGRVAGPRLFSWDIPFILFIEMVSPGDSVTALCQQLSQGLSQLTRSGSDDFNFNNSTINQNTLNLTLTTINNTYNQSITTTPMPAPTSATPVTLSFSPNFNRSTSSVTPSIASSVISNNVSSSNVTSSNNTSIVSNNLPKPEQWLGQIVKSTSPVLPLRMDGSSPRRPPSLGVHSRAVSLDSGAESFRPKVADPFDAEWAEIAARQNTNSTNPFLAPNVAPKAFQIQL